MKKLICLIFGHKWQKWWTSLYVYYQYKYRGCARCGEQQCIKVPEEEKQSAHSAIE